MSLSHCRWVVVAEDCYQEFTKAETHQELASTQATKEGASLVKEDTPTAGPAEEPINVTPSKGTSEENQEAKAKNGGTEEPLTKEEEKPDWTASLPPSYRKEGQKLLQQLLTSPGFSISSSGIVEIDSISLQDYSISSFLRSACIPFNKSPIPIQLQDWLRKTEITTFRNHLLKILPKWENRYSWRKSTMEGRKEPSGGPKPSTRKRRA